MLKFRNLGNLGKYENMKFGNLGNYEIQKLGKFGKILKYEIQKFQIFIFSQIHFCVMSIQKLFNQKYNIKLLYCTGIKHVGDKTQKELSNSKITYTSDAI